LAELPLDAPFFVDMKIPQEKPTGKKAPNLFLLIVGLSGVIGFCIVVLALGSLVGILLINLLALIIG